MSLSVIKCPQSLSLEPFGFFSVSFTSCFLSSFLLVESQLTSSVIIASKLRFLLESKLRFLIAPELSLDELCNGVDSSPCDSHLDSLRFFCFLLHGKLHVCEVC